jgi:multiple antibiotic resistance protein
MNGLPPGSHKGPGKPAPIDPLAAPLNLPSMPVEFLISAAVTLLVVVDPIGLAPTFLAVTHGLNPAQRRQVALRACLIATGILFGAAAIGDWLLRELGITLPAFRIAGGLLLFSIASEMVFGVRMQREARTAEQALEEHVHHVAAFPLAIPLMAGPGAITATILLAGQAQGRPLWLGIVFAIIAAVCAMCLATFLAAGRISRLLGVTGNVVLSRLLGVILAALAVQYVIDGVRAILAT